MKTKKFFFALLISFLFYFSSTTVKADTIHVQMPTDLALCQNSLAIDTLAFHKPLGFGTTAWYVEDVLSGTGQVFSGIGDIFYFIPSVRPQFQITAKYSGEPQICNLQLFFHAPSHAQFAALSSDATFNTGNDTVRVCTSSLSLGTGVSSTEYISSLWSSIPAGYNFSGDPATITSSGTYVHRSINTCDTTADTIVVSFPPTTLPTAWDGNDLSFCHEDVSIVLDATPGYTSYLWNGGATTQTLNVTSPGTYSVTV